MRIDTQKAVKDLRVVGLLLLLFLGLRIGAAILGGQTEFEGYDSPSYTGYATAILEKSDWLTDPDFPGHYRPPVYPMMIAGVYGLFGQDNTTALYILQAFLSALTCLFIYKLARELLDARIAFFSLIWAGLYIHYFNWVRMLYRETLIFLLILAFFYYLHSFLKTDKFQSQPFWIMTVLYFLLIHTDARYLFFLPFLAVLFVLYFPFRLGVRRYLAFLLLAILFMLPWTIRNYVAYKTIVLINTRTFAAQRNALGSYLFYQRVNRNILGQWPEISGVKNRNYPSEEERTLVKQGQNPSGRSAEEIEAIRKDKYPASTYWGRKMFWFGEFWRPVRLSVGYSPLPYAHFQKKYSLLHNLSSLLSYGLLLPLMVVGIAGLVKNKNKAWLYLSFPIFVQGLLHLLLWGRERYRIPVDGFIIILAMCGLIQTFLFLKNRIRT